MTDTMSTEAKFHCKRLLHLMGAKVVNIVVDDRDPHDVYCGLILAFPNGTKFEILAVRDPEFNGAGHLHVTEVPDGR